MPKKINKNKRFTLFMPSDVYHKLRTMASKRAIKTHRLVGVGEICREILEKALKNA